MVKLAWEHGPYYQTKRFDRYNQVIDEMIEQGLAYRCYCSKERLEELRHTQEQNKENHVMTVIVYMIIIMQQMSHMLYVLKTQQKVQSCLMMPCVVVLKSATVN